MSGVDSDNVLDQMTKNTIIEFDDDKGGITIADDFNKTIESFQVELAESTRTESKLRDLLIHASKEDRLRGITENDPELLARYLALEKCFPTYEFSDKLMESLNPSFQFRHRR
jgi:hypothetical protein